MMIGMLTPYLCEMPEKTSACPLVLFIAVLFLFNNGAKAQHPPMKDITDSMNILYPQIRINWGRNKTVPPALERQIFFALSYFPEFKKTKIHFLLDKTDRGIISTRPTWGSVFRKSSRRTYKVVMADSSAERGAFPIFGNGPANGQVGILGHELCHILYFGRHTGLGLIGLGINHISKKYMDRFENKTDSVDVERGLGWQLIAWNMYLRASFGKFHQPGAPVINLDAPVKRERYMSPASIRKMMATRPIYRPTLSE